MCVCVCVRERERVCVLFCLTFQERRRPENTVYTGSSHIGNHRNAEKKQRKKRKKEDLNADRERGGGREKE